MSQDTQPAVPPALNAAGLSLADKRALAERLLHKKAGAAGTRYPLSYSQRAMWFMHELDPRSSAYHVAFAARICAGVDVPALERAVQRLVERHPVLRTTFANGDDGPVQVVAPNRPAGFLHIVLAGADEDALRGEVLAAYAEPFDLETGPLLRVTLFTRPGSPSTPSENLLLIVAHHIIWDGWSVAITLNELMAIYAAEVQAQEPAEQVRSRPVPAPGPLPAAHYAGYVAWQREMLAGPEGARLWSYWQQELGGQLPVLALPTDRPRPALQSHAGATEVFTLGPELTAQLRNLARAEGVTLYMLMLAAFQLMLAHLAEQEDVLVGSPMAGRSQAAYTAVVGHFVNMVVVRVHCRQQEPFRQLLAQVRDKVLAALDHQEFPFALLVERLHAGRDPSRSPIFQVSFDLQQLRRFGDLAPLFVPNHPGAAVNVAGLTLEPYVIPQQEGQFDLALQLAEGDDTITGAFKFSTALFEADTVSRMQRTYETILEKILTEPNSAPITWMAGPERHGQAAELSGFLAQLRELDIKLWVDGEKLRVNAPAGSLTPELQREIGARKEAIVALLRLPPASKASASALKPLAGQSPRQGPLPLSFSQQRLWFLDQMNPGSAAYNIPMAVTIEGPLDVAALRRSLDEVVARHAVLRTRFVASGGEAGQVVMPPQPLAVPLIDLGQLGAEQRTAEARRLVGAEAVRPFDLAQGPLLRAIIIRLEAAAHLVVVTVHHIAADAWSLGILTRELGALYNAYVAGEVPALPVLPVQYADYAAWQRQWALGEEIEQELAYWTRQLAGPLPILDLPTDHPRPAVVSTRGTRREFKIERDVLDGLQALCRREGVTLYMALLASFNVLLYRYTRQEDILVGAPVAGRHAAEVEPLIGFFVNNLVLRTDLSGAPSFRELLGRVRKVMLEAFEHQRIPFDKLVEVLQPERDLSRLPFFQVLFNLHNASIKELQLAGLKLERYRFETITTRYDLTLEIWERPEGLSIDAEYSTDLFEEDTIRRLIGHYGSLLRAVVADPDGKVGDLPLLTPAEREQLLFGWNSTGVDYLRELPVHRLFEGKAAAVPGAVAVSCAGERILYAELNARANQLARHLQHLGVEVGTLVGIFMERSVEMVVALLAVHKAGGAYLPLDPAFPSDRLAFMLQDSQTRFLISQASLAEELPANQALVVFIDRDWPLIGAQPAGNLANTGSYDGERLAYVLYTSGSTGRPKGVQVPQRALVNFLLSMQRAPGLVREDILLSVTTLSFDIAGLEIFLPLITGAQLELVGHTVAADGAALQAVMNACGVSVMQATPATWRLLIGAGWQGTPGLKILCGGEAMPGELAGQLLARCASLWNMYGPTETTIWSTIYEVHTAEGIMPIGRPIANTQVYVLDEAQQPVPIGVAGELYIGGDGVAHGYLNRPELTAQKFVPDPFAPGEDARMYRTGDLVRYRPDGNLEFLGRIDFQVKIRGFRIELGEIEAVLEQHPVIRQAVVVAREDTPGDLRLVGYLGLNAERSPDQSLPASELRSYLKEKLPDYMVPAVFVTVDAFPLTPNGKVDRKALPAPKAAAAAPHSNHVAARSEVERRIAAIWQSVLGVEAVGVTDSFFDLGGHSLLIVQVHNQLRRSFDTNITIAQMFQYPTVESLAAYVQQPQAASSLRQAQAQALREQRALRQQPALQEQPASRRR